MASGAKPTVLFVHGSWHSPVHFRPIQDLFEANGYPTSCPALPTVGAFPPVGLIDDGRRVGEELAKLIDDDGNDVIIIAHSYGGAVASQAAIARLSKKTRAANSLEGGIIHIVFIAGFLLEPGDSLASMFGGTLPPCYPIDGSGQGFILEPEKLLFNDLPEEEQVHWAAALRPGSKMAPYGVLTHAGYLYHPVTYLLCEKDQAFPICEQRAMVKNRSLDHHLNIHISTCNSGHTPFLSQPECLLRLVKQIN